MKELGITKGEWEALPRKKVESHLDIVISTDYDSIAWVYSDSLITSKEDECLANAKLIADAGTTANKCNMLPSELLERYNEAIEVLKKIDSYDLDITYPGFDKETGIKQTISKAKME